MWTPAFSGMANAFQYGYHLIHSIDHLMILLLDEPNLWEVIPFPPNGKGMDLMMEAPAYLEEKQLRELHIQLDKKAQNIKEGKE